MCLGGGTTLSEGSASSFDCHYDIDGDGVVDRYDNLAHFSGNSLDGFVRGNIIFYFIFTIGVTLLRRENIG